VLNILTYPVFTRRKSEETDAGKKGTLIIGPNWLNYSVMMVVCSLNFATGPYSAKPEPVFLNVYGA
jgi:hypothetical protein